MSGYFTIANSLHDYYKEHGPLSAEELEKITVDDCTDIFGQEPENQTTRELMQLFTSALNDLGIYLIEKFNGSFVGLVETARSSAEALVRMLTEMPFYDDVEAYDGLSVPFYKRAQLMAADLSLASGGEGLGSFKDLDQLTIFADNLVPHVLRLEGILEYSPTLLQEIEAERLIPAGSDEEIEIRACSVHAVELMIEAAAGSGMSWTARDVDQVLWHQGQRPQYKKRGKRHRTRTVFY